METTTMRFVVLRKSDKNMESGALPGKEILAAMRKYDEELIQAGVLLAVERLQSSSEGTRINFSRGKFTAIDGPFAETKELIAGIMLIQANSKEEAIEWVKRCPTLNGDVEAEFEIRQVLDMSDLIPT
jgi:hypothetical protein